MTTKILLEIFVEDLSNGRRCFIVAFWFGGYPIAGQEIYDFVQSKLLVVWKDSYYFYIHS